MNQGRRRDNGSASVEMVLATPLLVLLLMAAVQFAVWAHATHMAQAAANEGLQTTRVYNGTATAGKNDTQAILDRLAGSVLENATVSTSRTATTASVSIHGHAASVIPGLVLPVNAHVSAPVETTP